MDSVKEILVESFISGKEKSLRNTLDYLLNNPDSYEKKLDKLLGILKVGISFGVEKGVWLEQCNSKKVKSFNEQKLLKALEEDLALLDDEIAEDMITNRYKKK